VELGQRNLWVAVVEVVVGVDKKTKEKVLDREVNWLC
jgi:hypothetical protein